MIKLKDKRAFTTSIPNVVKSAVILFTVFLGVRIIYPMLDMIFDFTWKSNITKYASMIGVYLVLVFFIFVLVFGTLFNKKKEGQ